MTLVDNRFKTLTLKGKWNAPSEQEEKLLTMEARLNAMKRTQRKMGKPRVGAKYPTGQNKKPEWMKLPPVEGVISKMWKTKLWHYCHPTTGGGVVIVSGESINPHNAREQPLTPVLLPR